jgi:hypothetical protein
VISLIDARQVRFPAKSRAAVENGRLKNDGDGLIVAIASS